MINRDAASAGMESSAPRRITLCKGLVAKKPQFPRGPASQQISFAQNWQDEMRAPRSRSAVLGSRGATTRLRTSLP
jgi:hypothetical protein